MSSITSSYFLEEFRVMFADKSLLRLQIVGGVHTATADEIISFVVEEMQLGDEARNLFALWIMSPSLELQLKPHHVVYQVLNQWASLVEKHGEVLSSEPDSAIWSSGGLLDEIPVVVFRRNVFYPIEKEKILICRPDFPESARRLLYAEAAQNLLCGRLVSGDPFKYHELAGLRATIEFGRFNEELHNDAFYEDKLDLLYPEHVISWKNSATGSSVVKYFATGPCAASLKRKFIDNARRAHQDVTNGPYGAYTSVECQQRYLSLCSELPIYASAFFSARLRLIGRFWGTNDVSVVVAINGYGVCVLNDTDMSLLTALSYRYLTPILDKDSDSLHLKFTTRQPGASSSPSKHEFVLIRDLHLISKQVALMNELIKTFAMLHDEKARRSAPSSEQNITGKARAFLASVSPTPVVSQSLPVTQQQQLYQPSRREQEFWTNKYKRLRLPSFRKETDL